MIKKLREFYTDHIDPDGIQPIHACRTAVAAILAIVLYHAFNWSQAYWILFSTILILQTYNSPTPRKKWQFLFISGILAIISTFTASLLCNMPYVLPVFLMLTTFIAVYSNVINTDVGNAAFYVNLFCLSSGAIPVNFVQTLERTASVGMGFLIAILVCLFLWPERLSKSIEKIILENVSRLNEFNRVLTERAKNTKAISIRRNRLMRGFQLARRIIPPEEIQSWQIMRHIEYLYELTLILHDDTLTKNLYEDAEIKYKKTQHMLNILMKQKGYL